MNTVALQKIGYGMYVIASRKGDKLNGQIANTLFQITSEPPTVAVSINKSNLTHDFIKESKVFSASVLCQDTPLSFIGQFGFKSGRDTNKLEGVSYKTGETKAPVVIENATSYLEVRVTKEVDMGTHTIFIGEVVAAEVLSDKPCMTYDYYHQVKRGSTPKTAPTFAEKVVTVKLPSYQCSVCGYIYDPERGDPDGGIKPGTPFAELPDGWVCPVCGADKTQFERME
ncbi:MAG: High molecular weight rubredoxin [Dehalococcoidales bacterium]|nr:High molecular weight rubredoxin [Dehalococcoidales bacterium]